MHLVISRWERFLSDRFANRTSNTEYDAVWESQCMRHNEVQKSPFLCMVITRHSD